MLCRDVIVLSGVLVLLAGCSGGENPQEPTVAPPTPSMAQQAYVKALNTGASDRFGGSLALGGSTLVVGVPAEDSDATGMNGNEESDGETDSGAVYVFGRGANGVWGKQAYIKASNTGARDGFGGGVALAGTTLAVGAPFEDSSATGVNDNSKQGDDSAGDSGAVYIFTRASGAWVQEAYVKASNTGSADGFGGPIALSGNILAVGASSEDSKATGVNDNGKQGDDSAFNSGAVYVFAKNNSGIWSQEAYVKASNTEARDGFGWQVALDGNTLVVGAPKEASALTGVIAGSPDEATTGNGASESGAVYVFTRANNGIWTQQAYLKASDAMPGDQFGASVALVGNTLAIGAPFKDSNAGTVYMFTRVNGVWKEEIALKGANTEAGDTFGDRVALDGNTLAVGALHEDSSAKGINSSQDNNDEPDSGAVYVFKRVNGSWSQQAYVKASNTEAGDNFGGRVALDGSTLAIAAAGEDSSAIGVNGVQNDNGAQQSGAVYVMQ